MAANSILAVAYLISSLTEAGLSVSQIIAEVRATGLVPDSEWDNLEQDLKQGADFWKRLAEQRQQEGG